MKKMRKRVAGIVAAAVMAVTGVVSGLPANAAKTVSNLTGTNETEDVTLLIGEKSSLRGETVEQTIQNVNDAYALGIASQFCVFLDGDFTEYDSDAEGRVAIAGDFYFKDQYSSYAMGKGDYLHHVNLKDLLNDTGYANVIMGGTVKAGQMDDTYFGPDATKDNEDMYNAGNANKTGDSGRRIVINREDVNADDLGDNIPETTGAEWKKSDPVAGLCNGVV